jgi:molybdenum cofactor synthesis domain-containing protein
MISVSEALAIVLDCVEALEAEEIELASALCRVLREDVRADIDLPPFDRSNMDGYALRSEDAKSAPARLQLIGEVAAGSNFNGRVGPGQAVKIFTGAPIPEGADAVQKIESTESDGNCVIIKEKVVPGQFITRRASQVRAGEVLLRSGQTIGPAHMAALASFGYSRLKVGRRPRIRVLSTGSELVEVWQKPEPGQIRNSNTYVLTSYALAAGAEAAPGGIVHDTLEATVAALLEAGSNCDLVITSGGVSMGDYDLVKAALKEIGAEIYFDRIRLRPGKPTVFARRGRTYFFGLPGNPVSTSVTFNLFVRPAIRKLQGDSSPLLPSLSAEASREINDPSSRRSYLPGRFFLHEGRALVEPLKWEGSSDLAAFMKANALIVVPEQVHHIAAGQMVETVLLAPV